MLKNFKYYAGFTDSDGYVGLSFNKSTNNRYSVYASVAIRNRWDQAEKVLLPLESEFNTKRFYQEKTNPPGEMQIGISLTGNKAIMFLNQIKNHCIIKKELITFVTEANGKSFTEEELPAIRSKIKELRADTTLSRKDYPSRQWTAGYIDGDGCFSSSVTKEGYMSFKLVVASHKNDPQGVMLLAKHYGGVVNVRKDGNLSYVLVISKGSLLLSDVLPHLKIKRVQAELIQEVLNKGSHLKKNGATFESNQKLLQHLKMLKQSNQPQRLNETPSEEEATV